jgi:hypothetical protein
VIPRTLSQYLDTARRNGVKAERLDYGIAIACPVCESGQSVILDDKLGLVLGTCRHCGATSKCVAFALGDLDKARSGQGSPTPLMPTDSIRHLRESSVTKEIEGTLALPFAPISSALAGTPERPDWVWDGYVAPRAVTLLAGRPKVGKSTLLFAFAAAVTRGHLLLDSPTRSARILLLSEERGDTLREKRERWGLNDDVHLLMRHQAPGSKWPEIVEQAVAHCSEHHLDVLAVDTWDKWAGLGGDSENSSGAVLEALKPLADAAGGGLAVIISAHERKSYGEYGEAVRGSNALTGAVDVIVEIERAKLAEGGTARVLRTVSRFDQAPPDELVVLLDEQGYQARGNLADMRAGRGAWRRAPRRIRRRWPHRRRRGQSSRHPSRDRTQAARRARRGGGPPP